jgi:signal transduction histidine kinase
MYKGSNLNQNCAARSDSSVGGTVGKMQLPETLYSAGHKPFDPQIERLIAFLRVVLAAFSLVLVSLDPIGRDQDRLAIIAVLIAYTAFAMIIAFIPVVGKFRTGWQLPVHLVDVGLISLLLNFRGGVSSQFFLLYSLVLLGATVRWNWRGAAGTTVLLLGFGLISAFLWPDNDQNGIVLNLLTHSTSVLIIGGMFTFFGASREQSQMRLAQLAGWPAPPTNVRADLTAFPLDAALSHVASVLHASRILLLWEQSEEPFLHIALFANGRSYQDQRPADAFGKWTGSDLATITFASADLSSKRFITVTGAQSSKDSLISPSLQSEFQLKSIASAPVATTMCTGRIFMLDKSDWGDDDLTLTEIVASRIGIELDHHALSLQLADTATTMERIRLARDLHDGILQSLTAAGLQLKSVESDLDPGSKSRIDNVRRLLLDEQQRIRAFVEERQISVEQPTLTLHRKVQELIDKQERQWGCKIVLSDESEDAEIRSNVARQLDFILGEAIANAVRHGQASHIDVTVRKALDRVLLWIRDNGHGLIGSTGTFNITELATRKIGPASIRNRIVELGGSLTLSSSPQGAELAIELPT